MDSSTAVPADRSRSAAGTAPAAQTAGYFIAFIGLGLFSALLGPTLAGLAENTRATLGEVSILFPARSFGYLIGALAAGRLYDRVRGHPVIVASFVVMALAMALAPVVSWLWLLVFVFFIASIAEGAVDVGGNTLLVWVHGARVGPFMNALHFFFGVGTFVAPIIVAQAIAMSDQIVLAYWLVALGAAVPALWHLRVPSPAHPVVHYDPADVRSHTRTGLALLMAVFFFLYVGMEVAFGGWIASYAVAIGYGSAAAAAVLTSAFWGAFMVGRLLSVPLATRLRAGSVMAIDFALCMLGMAIFLLGGGSPPALWVGTVITGLGMAALFPTMISFAGSRMRITGQVTAIFLAGSSLGGMTLPWLIGQLFEPIGPQVMPWVVLICTLATGLTFVLVNVASRLRSEQNSR